MLIPLPSDDMAAAIIVDAGADAFHHCIDEWRCKAVQMGPLTCAAIARLLDTNLVDMQSFGIACQNIANVGVISDALARYHRQITLLRVDQILPGDPQASILRGFAANGNIQGILFGFTTFSDEMVTTLGERREPYLFSCKGNGMLRTPLPLRAHTLDLRVDVPGAWHPADMLRTWPLRRLCLDIPLASVPKLVRETMQYVPAQIIQDSCMCYLALAIHVVHDRHHCLAHGGTCCAGFTARHVDTKTA